MPEMVRGWVSSPAAASSVMLVAVNLIIDSGSFRCGWFWDNWGDGSVIEIRLDIKLHEPVGWEYLRGGQCLLDHIEIQASAEQIQVLTRALCVAIHH
jgi:hypothetical protein